MLSNLTHENHTEQYDVLPPIQNPFITSLNSNPIMSRRNFLKAATTATTIAAIHTIASPELAEAAMTENTLVPLIPTEAISSADLIDYKNTEIPETQLDEALNIFNTTGLLQNLKKNQAYLACLLASLNHSESSWPMIPYKNLAPQLITMDLITDHLNPSSQKTLSQEIESLAPQNGGFIFSALSGRSPQTINRYLISKANQLTATQYAQTIFKLHLQVVLNAMHLHKSQEEDSNEPAKFFPNFSVRKIFDPASDKNTVLDAQLAWINQNPNATAVMFSKGQNAKWFLCGEKYYEVENDPLQPYIVPIERVAQELKTY